MEKLALVSTLICTYNAEHFIRRTLDSVIGQTYKNQEILILDNGSKDKTTDIIKEYQKRHSNIILFDFGKNLGAYAGLNYLLDQSKGEYIAIQDHDDIWHSQKIEEQVNFLETHKEYIGTGTGTLMYYGYQKLGFFYDLKPRDTTKVIHTSLVFRNEGFRYNTDIEFLVDGFFMEKILTKGKNVLKVIPKPLTLHYYKGNGTNYSEQRFKINIKNTKIFFSVYGRSFYYFLIFIYICICKALPVKMKNQLDFKLLCRFKGAKKKEVIEKENIYAKELLKYY